MRPIWPLLKPALPKGFGGWTVAGAVCLRVVGFADVPLDVSKLPPSTPRPVNYAKDIQPIFAAHCYSCHGPEKQKSHFRLDLKSVALKGGERGQDIVPGKSAESPLIHFVARLVPDMEMPAKGDPLSRDEIGLLRAWIDQGAIWPPDAASAHQAKADEHWAFRPMSHPAPPAIPSSGATLRNPIDRFIVSRLATEGLAPSPEADRRTLIRRLSFDLIGLPPTPQEVKEFERDSDPQAYERVVDRLLASPHYGERWARHWLDVVHYGESHGYDKDKPRLNAWPYRDYVIRSFNADKPYSRFVGEQLAGDALYPDDPDGVVALGFISAGPWDYVGHAELPESKMDGLIARYNDRDDMVMTAMSTFLSLTVHCARCHDHKFDPISSHEYYSLQAVFAGVDRADRPYDKDPKIFAERRKLTVEKEALQARQSEIARRIAKLDTPALRAADAELKELKTASAALPSASKESPSNGYHSGIEAAPDTVKWVQVDLGSSRSFDEVRLIPARPTDFPDTPGFGFPHRFRVEASDEEQFKAPQRVADYTRADFANPGDNAFVAPVKGLTARYIRITATKLWERTSDYVFALGEMQVFAGTNNLALGAAVQALDSIESGRWRKSALVDGCDSRKKLDTGSESLELAAKRRRLEERTQACKTEKETAIEAALDDATKTDRRDIQTRLNQLESRLGELPPPQMVYAAASKFAPIGSFAPSNGPRQVHFLRRGSVKMAEEAAEPGALSCVPGLSGALNITNSADESQRRAALARWLTDPRDELLRRSIVNRVWYYHFGRGIVDTPNDFGHMGGEPSHPELLDWLANWFQENGESIKSLHKLIVMSAAYRQTSAITAASQAAMAKDSDNRLLWRMNRQRLDAESLRDAILAASGALDPTMGGTSVQQFWFKDDHSPIYDYTRFDVDSPAALRRSIYRFIVRSVPDPFMDTMDCPDASVLTAKRSQTMTPLQALSLLNNPFVLNQAERFATRLASESSDPAGQIRLAYEIAFGRQATAAEVAAWASYSGKFGLPNACRMLLNGSEFVFLD